MRAGRLDRTLSLQRLTTSVDSAGTVTSTWADFATGIRAELLPPSIVSDAKASRLVESAETDFIFGRTDETILTFRVRYLAGVTVADRVVYEGNNLMITGATELGRRRGLDIRCRSIA